MIESVSAEQSSSDQRSLSDEQIAQVIELAMEAARTGATDEVLGFVGHGLPIDVQDPQGNTLLMLAAYAGHRETVASLLGHGADSNIANDRNQPPVAGALFKGEDEVVRLLIAAGADLDAGVPTAREAAMMFGREHLLD